MSECSHDCQNCSSHCGEAPEKAALNAFSHIRKVVAVTSGKGGVGKSSVTAMLAVLTARKGYKVGVLDADITGPSIPRAFGVTRRAQANEMGILPEETHMGIRVMSINLLLESEDQPVVWRGPVLGGAVTQFWTDVAWGDLDVLFIDMPPGTGDVPLTVFQSLPIDGIIVVTSPQDLVSMIVTKAVKMAQMMNIPVLGLVENYSYLTCPDCGKKIEVFGKSKIDDVAKELGLPVLCKLPIDPLVAQAMDEGLLEHAKVDAIAPAADALEKL